MNAWMSISVAGREKWTEAEYVSEVKEGCISELGEVVMKRKVVVKNNTKDTDVR